MATELSSSKSSYAESLDQLQYATYQDKLALIEGLDPYTVPNEAILHDIEALPKITHRDIFDYLLFSPSRFTIDDMKDCQSLEAYNAFFRGWVRDVGVIQIKEDTCVVRAMVMNSEQLGTTPLCAWVIACTDGTVQAAHCDCVDGLSETCTHVAALLFTVEANVRVFETGTVDDEEVNWMMPSTVEKLLYRTISDTDFTPGGAKAGKRSQPTANSVEASSCPNSMLSNTVSPPKKIHPPTPTEINDWYSASHATSAMCSTVPVIKPYSDELVCQAVQNTSGMAVPNCSGSNPCMVAGCAEEPVISQDNVWCLCKGAESGRMIACDNQDCSIEWFHYACVGIKRKPKGRWYCPECNMKQQTCYPYCQ